MAVITVSHISKKYQQLTRQDRFPTLRDQLLPGKNRGRSHDFWALKDINFKLNRGQVLGVIGHNGAGKSTLFKIISKVTRPTTGEVILRGRVSSMLEVGTGFHPELSGRENIFLNGAILGMKHQEIAARFDEIVEFAQVENFLDDPVKYYSSGMYARLAFAIASFLTSEIMIIDEVLSVGDSQFQRKCQQKIKQLVRDQGRTVLIVSHNLTSVEELADYCLWLDHGETKMYDQTKKVLPAYRQAMQIPVKKCK